MLVKEVSQNWQVPQKTGLKLLQLLKSLKLEHVEKLLKSAQTDKWSNVKLIWSAVSHLIKLLVATFCVIGLFEKFKIL